MKLRAIVSIIIATLITWLSFGESYIWIAGNSGDWNSAANWEPNGVPTLQGDIASFTNSVTISPNISFNGTFAVAANAIVAATYSSPASISTSVAKYGRFEKYGVGEVTIRAVDGFNYGDIAILEGTALFAGNGLLNAPGLFGNLEVAAGATVRIIESPAEARHSMVSWGVFDNRTFETECADFNTYNKLQARWYDYSTNSATFKKNFSVGELGNHYTATRAYLPNEISAGTNYNFNFITKGIVILPSSSRRLWFLSDADGASYFYLGSADRLGTALNRCSYIARDGGFAPYFLGFASDPSGNSLSSITMNMKGNGNENYITLLRDDVISRGNVWNGVCFTGITLPAGARLEIANDQAVALALSSPSKLMGEVIALGTNSHFSIMYSATPVDLAPLDDFNGKLELGIYAKAYTSSATDDIAYDIIGDGNIIISSDAIAKKIGKGFYGVIEVPAGKTFTSTIDLEASVLFKGYGTVAVTEGAPTPSGIFKGTIKLDDSMDIVSTYDEFSFLNGISLGNNGNLTYGFAPLINYGYQNDIAPLGEKWTISGNAETNNAGVITLSSDASQASMAWLNQYLSKVNDSWKLHFTYTASPTENTDTVFGDGFALLLRSTWSSQPLIRNITGENYIVNDSGCFGFGLYYKDNNRQGLEWYGCGRSGVGKGAPFEMMPEIDFFKPINITVIYSRGRMNVELEQDGSFYEFENHLSSHYTYDINPHYIGFAASTDTLENGRLKQEISNISGWFHQPSSSGPSEEQADFALATNNWEVFIDASWTNENSALNLVAETSGTTGRAICKTPIALSQPFTLSYKITQKGLASKFTYSAFAATLQNQGLAVSNSATSGSKTLATRKRYDGRLLPSIANSISVYFQPYWGYSKSELIFRTNPSTFTGSSQKTMHSGTSEQAYDFEITHDGEGTIAANSTYQSYKNATSLTAPQLTAEAIGNEFYLMLSAYNGIDGSSYAKAIIVEDLKMNFLQNQNPSFDLPVTFGGDGTLTVGAIGKPKNKNAATFSNLIMQNGGTLTIAPEVESNGTMVDIGISLSEETTLVAKNNTTVTLSTIRQAGSQPATLVLDGAFNICNEGLTIVIPSTCSDKRGFAILDTTTATFANGIDCSQIHFVDENGKTIKKFYAIMKDGALYAWFAGPSLFIIR